MKLPAVWVWSAMLALSLVFGWLVALLLMRPGVCPLPDCDRIDSRIQVVLPLASLLTTLWWARGRKRRAWRDGWFWLSTVGWGAINAMVTGLLWTMLLVFAEGGRTTPNTVLLVLAVNVFGAPLLGFSTFAIPVGSAVVLGLYNALLPVSLPQPDPEPGSAT